MGECLVRIGSDWTRVRTLTPPAIAAAATRVRCREPQRSLVEVVSTRSIRYDGPRPRDSAQSDLVE